MSAWEFSQEMIYLSPVRWDSFAQRPHKFVEWFHRESGAEVLWIDPYPTRLPVLGDLKKLKLGSAGGSGFRPDWLTVVRPKALPIEPLPGLHGINQLFWLRLIKSLAESRRAKVLAIGKPSEMALRLLRARPDLFSLYDAMDDFPAFYSGWSRKSMARREKLLARSVKLVVVSAQSLADKFAALNISPRLILNACSTASLPAAESLPPKAVRPVIGYVGTIGPWFDWPLTLELARRNPLVDWHIIGPLHCAAPETPPPNLKIFPACRHEEAIELMANFSAGLIPFKRTLLTESVDPIKYYEYAALGLPVLSTSFGEMINRGGQPGVFLIDDNSDLQATVEKAVNFRSDPEKIKSFRADNDWSNRFGPLLADLWP